MNQNVTKEDLKKCLRLLKNFLYTERNYALAKTAILDELSLKTEKEIIDEVYDALTNFDCIFWKDELVKINYYTVPKKTSTSTNVAQGTTFINCINPSEITIEEINLFIKYPVSIGILNVLFIYLNGEFFEKDLSHDCLGNRLNLNPNKEFKRKGFTIYKNYFNQYKKWRDKSIRLSKELHQNDNDVLLINLDLKRYFYSVDLDFSHIYSKLGSTAKGKDLSSRIIQILEATHNQFSKEIHIPNICLPIGLPTSGLLANWILSDFDKKTKAISRAASYGRYVDDIIIVVSNPKLKAQDNFSFDINEYISTKNLKKKKNNELVSILPDEVIKNSNLYLNNNKIKWFYFRKRESISLIDKFIQELNELSSEWKLLPDETQMKKNLVNEGYNEVTSTDGSVKNLKELIPNKNSLALYFEKAIVSSMFDESKKRDFSIEVIEFLSGKQLIDNISFWDRAFTLMVSSKNPSAFLTLYKKVKYYINNIKFIENNKTSSKNSKKTKTDSADVVATYLHPHVDIHIIRNDLHRILEEVCAYAMSLNISFLKDSKENDIDKITTLARKIRSRGFCKRHYTIMPMFCSHQDALKDDSLDLTSIHSIHKILQLKLSKEKFLSTFHYISMHEIFTLIQLKEILKAPRSGELHLKDLEEKAQTLFQDINNLSAANFSVEIKASKNKKSHTLIVGSKTPNSSEKDKLILGVSSIKIEEKNIENYIHKRTYDIQKNFLEISKIFNHAMNEKCNFLIFPENSVCLELLPILLRESARNNIGLVLGLKHYIYDDYVFNLSCTILPSQNAGFSNLLCILRPKSYFAPGEICLFEQYYNTSGSKLICYEGDQNYNLYRWKGFTFTVFNCFELADIKARSFFRSKIDLLVAIEFNVDTNYFSNLIESSVRDIHCIAAQCNNSKYGDSRVTQPTKTESKDIIKIKGGDNSYVVVCELEFENLRNFQKLDYNGQLAIKKYKPTPPGFNRSYTFRREKY